MPVDSPKTDIFRFMHVIPPRKISPENFEEKFITYEIGPSTYFTSLIDHLDDTSPREAIETEARSAEGTSAIYSGSGDIYLDFTNFDRISAYLFDNLSTITKNELKNKIQEEVGTSLSTFVQNGQYVPSKLKVWDTLFYTEIIDSKDGFLRDLMNVLRICRLIELLNENSPLVEFNAGIQTQANASITLPKPLFPLPKRVMDEMNHQSEAETAPNLRDIKLNIADLASARADVITTYEVQKSEARSTKLDLENYSKKLVIDPLSGDDSRPQPYTSQELRRLHEKYKLQPTAFSLETTYFNRLKPETIARLTQLGFTNKSFVVSDVLREIDKALEENYAALQKGRNKSQIVRTPSGIIRVERRLAPAAEESGGKPATVKVTPPYVQPLGIGDMLVVREQLLKYEEGEIAHIENILATERKFRSTRSLSRTETIAETETFNETLHDTETRSNTQFEMSQAMNSASQSANQSASGISISARYGTVQADAFAQHSAQSSNSTSESQATQIAKDFSESARQRIIESVRELRITASLKELEIKNEHETDNTAPDASHKIGHYHWLDKKYLNQVYNIGKRLMYEFLIPEPAAFYIFSLMKQPQMIEYPEVPVHPFKLLMEEMNLPLSHALINRSNYGSIAAQAKVTGIQAPPASYVYVGTALTNQNTQAWNLDSYNDSIKIPDGYVATGAKVVLSFSEGNDRYTKVKVGGVEFSATLNAENTLTLNNLTGKVPISVHSAYTYYAVNVVAECTLTEKAYAEWQLSVFNKIMQAHYDAVAQYNFEIQSIEQEIRNTEGDDITGYNPDRNRVIERTELKKAAIKFLSGSRYDEFDSMVTHYSELGYPDFDFGESVSEGKFIRFFEQAFEWDNMTYHHNPYFWGRKENWMQIMHLEDNDPKFSDFLKAGATRVVVPVRPSFTKAMLHYQANGEIWAGQDLPDLDDELHLSIVEEIQDAQVNFDGEPQGEPWIVKLPTNLIRLNASTDPELPDHSNELL